MEAHRPYAFNAARVRATRDSITMNPSRPIIEIHGADVTVDATYFASRLARLAGGQALGRDATGNQGMHLLIIGAIVTIAAWVLAWSRAGVLSEHSFFPLWLGYILTVNGISDAVFQTSLLRVMRGRFLWLFAASVPLWWFFEAVNRLVRNWEYMFAHPISDLHYVVEASLDFSTVVPAVLSTAFLAYRILESRASVLAIGPAWRVCSECLVLSLAIGLASFLGFWLAPHETFALVWIAPILILEPVAYVAGFPSLLRTLEGGRYLLSISLMSSTLFTGFFWEMWNYYSLPKWVYHIPYVGFWKIFEMPALGYLGYPFFGLIVFTWTLMVFAGVFHLDLRAVFEHPGRQQRW